MVDWLVCLVPRPLGATPRPPWRRTPSGQHLSSLHTTPLILATFHKDYLSAFSSDQDRDRKKDVEQNSALNSIVQILHIFFTCGFGDFFFIKRVQIWIRLDNEKMFLEKEKKSNATK